METTDLLGLGTGDAAETAPDAPPSLKRDHDSLDDFEHLEREQHARDTELLQPTLAPLPTPDPEIAPHATSSLQDFLDMEREGTGQPRRAFNVDYVADKFTDSESEAEPTGESPHRAAPPVPPHAAGVLESLKPTPIPADPPKPTPVVDVAPKPVPVLTPAPTASLPDTPPTPPPRPAVRPPAPPSVVIPPPVQREISTAPVIEAEVLFCQMGLDAWFNPERLHPKVEALIYWRDPARSGAALGAGLALLVALACCSVVSVLAYTSLLVLTGTVAFRIYKNVLQAVQKTSEGHPFKWLLDIDISLPAERSQQVAAAATAHANAAANELRRLFLVEDLIDSLKFGVLLWSLTYVGAWFNGITLFILGYVALFTLPKAYEANKAQVDANLELARAKIHEISTKVRAAVPLGKKESDKDK